MSHTSDSTDTGKKGNVIRGIIVVIVLLTAFSVFYAKDLPFFRGTEEAEPTETAETQQSLPTLIDIGSDKCIPCKEMEPILEELKDDYAGRMNVRFINVRTEPKEAKQYDIRLIPTQIFYSADGTELFRHEGFFAKKDIMQKWEELGINFTD